MSDQPQSSAPIQETESSTSESSETESTNQVEQTTEAQAKAVDADPTLTKTEKQEIKKRLKSLKLKVDGKEFNEELPFEIDDDPKAIEYMTKHLQMSKMGSKRAQDYSKLEKDVQDFVERLRKNPAEVLSDPSIGIDIKQLAAKVIENEIENAKKSPEQLEKEKLELELKKIKDEREKEKKDSQAKELERLQQQEYERYDVLLTQALETSDLPKSPYIVKKMAEYMIMGIQEGIDVTPNDVVPLVREEMQNDLREMFAIMPEDVIEQIIGKDVISRIRKKNLAKAKQAPQTVNSVKDSGKSDTPKVENAKKMTIKELFGI